MDASDVRSEGASGSAFHRPDKSAEKERLRRRGPEGWGDDWGDIWGGVCVEVKMSFDFDLLTNREKGAPTSLDPCKVLSEFKKSGDSSVVGDANGLGDCLGGGSGASFEFNEVRELRRARYDSGRKALAKNCPMRLRGRYKSAMSSGSGSGWTVDFHNILSHLMQYLSTH